MTDLELAWAVGLFEGEGSFNSSSHQMQLGSTDLDVLERFQAVCGGRIYKRKPPQDGQAQVWDWRLSPYLSMFLAERMLPLLGDRREAQAAKFLATMPKRMHTRKYGVCNEGHPCGPGGNCPTCNREYEARASKCIDCAGPCSRKAERCQRCFGLSRRLAPS